LKYFLYLKKLFKKILKLEDFMTTSVESQRAGFIAQAGSALSGTVETVKGAGSVVGNAAINTVSSVASVAGGAISAVGAAVPKGLVVLDKVLDFIPFGSTANNLVDLGVKHLVVKDMDPNSSAFKEYVEHVQKKDSRACILYGIPFVGNVAKIGTVVYSFVSGGEEEKKSGDGSFNLPPALGEAEDGSTLAARLLENEHGALVYRDPLELAGASGGSYHVNSAAIAQEVQRL
jgi:hypothetical protein